MSPPVANAGGPYSGTVGTAVTFNGAGSSDPQRQALTYAWSFGDGSLGTGVNPSHTYTTLGTYSVTLTVTDISNLSNTATGQAAIAAAPPPASPTVTAARAPLRTRYLRTNTSYDPNSLQYAPPHFSVYDSAHQQFFVSNPYMNEIDVFSAVNETQTATISVPMAWGMDISSVDGSLWAGTLLGDVYNVNTSTLSVIARYPASSIGPTGFAATTALALADGRLALQGNGNLGILGVDGFGGAMVWNPKTNAVDTGTSQYGIICPYAGGGVALDGTRTLILMTTVDENEPLPLCSYNTVTRVETDANFTQQQITFMRQIVATPDGTKFFLTTNLDGVEVFNPATLQLIGQIPPPVSGFGLPNAAGGGLMSLDGKTLYLMDQSCGTIEGYDTTTYKQVSTIAHPEINDSQSWMVASAIDSTGLMIGPIGHGVGFADASVPEGSLAEDCSQLAVPTPDTGPVSGGTAVTIGGGSSSYTLSQFYIGNSSISGATMGSGGISATTPAASSGMAVDLTALFSEGTIALAPEGYSYGPTILDVVPNAATADGGQQGALVGYGFGTSASALRLEVGGQVATVQALHDSAPVSPYPFPVETVTFTIPPGVVGTTTVSITSPSGTATGTFTYTRESVSHPVSASLQEGIYDAHRNLYFFSDTAKIQVFSPASGAWQTPITLPGTTSASQLLAIAESPDGSLLAVSDYGGQAIYVLNPGNPSAASRYPMPIDYAGISLLAPSGLAVLDNGNIYFNTADIGGTGTPAFHELAASNGQITNLPSLASGGGSDSWDRVLLSPDQTKVYVNVEGATYWFNTATNAAHGAGAVASNDGGEVDGAVSGDGSTLFFDGYFTDSLPNPENVPAYIDWETWLPSATYGQKLNQNGSILYQPLTNGIDLVERNTGRLLYRVQVPGTIAGVYDSLFLGPAGTLGYITSSGITFVDLSTLSMPAAASAAFPSVRPVGEHGDGTGNQSKLKSVLQTEKGRSALTRAKVQAEPHGINRAQF